MRLPRLSQVGALEHISTDTARVIHDAHSGGVTADEMVEMRPYLPHINLAMRLPFTLLPVQSWG